MKAGTATISPSRESYGVQLLNGGNVNLTLSSSVKYPVGYTVTLLRYGDTRGTMQIQPGAWNTLTKAVTVPSSGVTLRRRSDGKFELTTTPALTTAVKTTTTSSPQAIQAAAVQSYVDQFSLARQSATAAAIDALAKLRAAG